MNFSIIRYILSSVLAFEGIFLLLPCAVGAIYGEREAFAYLFVAALSICFGFLGRVKKPKSKEIYSKGGACHRIVQLDFVESCRGGSICSNRRNSPVRGCFV